MSDEWWAAEIDVTDEAGPPVVRKPRELDEVDKYRMPTVVTAKWVTAQLSKSEWAHIKRTHTTLKLNPFMIESMCKDARKGLPKRAIMARAGYHVNTWSYWERKAAEGEQPYALWYQCMMLSISSVEEELLDDIRMQTQGDWKAAKWLLEQLNKDEYGPTPSTQITNIQGDVNNEKSVNYMTDDDALAVAKLLQSIGAVPEIDNVVEGEVVEEDHPDA